MATPFPFVAGAVLEAAELNAITTLPLNDQTASYTLVVGDVGKRVVMNVASANTVTVNNSIFGVGDTVQIVNKGAGVSTVTAGAGVTINTSDSLALAQYQSGTLVALSASTFLFFPSSETAPASGLTLISSTTIGSAVSSVTVSSAFSSTYDNYLITVSGGVGSTAQGINLQLGSTTTGYYQGAWNVFFAAGNTSATNTNNGSSFPCGLSTTDNNGVFLFVRQPNMAKPTIFFAFGNEVRTTGGAASFGAGFEASTTQHTAFTLSVAGTMTGGTIKVYGLQN
jgi:hypothetical protein